MSGHNLPGIVQRFRRHLAALVAPPGAADAHRALMPISVALFAEMFLLPEATRIVDAELSYDGFVITLVLEDDRIRSTQEGAVLPEVNPIYRSHEDGLIQAEWPWQDHVGDRFPPDPSRYFGEPAG